MPDFFSQLMANPRALMQHSYNQAFALTANQIAEFQQHWLAKRLVHSSGTTGKLSFITRIITRRY